VCQDHWRRLVKNIGWANQNIGGKVITSDKCMGVSQLLGARARASPKSTPMARIMYGSKKSGNVIYILVG